MKKRIKDKQISCTIRKTFTCFLAVVFIINFIQPQILPVKADARSADIRENSINLDIDTFTIPMHLGDIKYSHKGSSEKVIIHIQDAHCNEYAQHKISDLIDYLNKEYGIEVVNLEGGVGPYDLNVFTSISGEAIRREVADYFVKTGEINGAEFYAINNPESVVLWGIENKDLYVKNLQVYRDSLKYKKVVEKSLNELTYLLNNLKRHIFNSDLLKIDIAYNTYKAGNSEFKDYLSFLVKRAKESAIQVRDYPNLYLLSQSLEKEQEVDFNRANIERNVLIDELKKTLSKNEVRELVSKTIEFKTKKISRKIFYNYIYEKAKEVGVETKRFPQLSGYVVYVALYEAVDRYKVMEEMYDLEAAIKEPFYENDIQRELNILSKTLALTKNIFAITLTKDDYRYYLTNKDLFKVENYIRFINREKPKYRITAEVSDNIADLNGYLESIVKFYEYSFERDQVFLQNMRFTPRSGVRGPGSENAAKPSAAIMVTGGFHTENLCELLEKEDYSYISILPKFINPKDYECPYFDLLAGQTTNLQSMLTSVIAKTAMMQIASHLNSLGNAVYKPEGMTSFDLAVRVVEKMVERKNQEKNKVVVLVGGKDTKDEIRITSIGEGYDEIKVDISEFLPKRPTPEPDGPRSGAKEETVDTNTTGNLSDRDTLIIKNLDQVMNFAKNNILVNSGINKKYADAYTEQYAVHETMKSLENGRSIVVVTAETSTFSDLNRWGHTEVDTIRDEFGGNFGRLLNEKKNDLEKIGIEFIGFYNPYGGRWHYMFSSTDKYDQNSDNHEKLAEILEGILRDATQETKKLAKTIIDKRFVTDEIDETDKFNVNLGISDPFKELLKDRPDSPYSREEIRRRKIEDILFRFADGEKEKEEWDKFLKYNPSLSDTDVIDEVFNYGNKDKISEGLGFTEESWNNKDEFRKNYLEYVENETDAEYYKEVINDAIYDSHNMIAYAENEYFAKNYMAFASREKRGDLDVFSPKVKAPPKGLIKVFSHEKTPEVVRFLRDKNNVRYLKQRKVNPNIPNFTALDEYVKDLKKGIVDNGGENKDLKKAENLEKDARDFIAKMVDLKIKSRRGVLRGVDVINTVTKKFADKALENGSQLFRLNVDFDYLSKAPTKPGDKIIVEGLSIIEEVFREKFGKDKVAVIQKGAGDESVVVGYSKGDSKELENKIKEAIAEINAKLADLKFDGKEIRYDVPDPNALPSEPEKMIKWTPSISAGLAFFNPKDVVSEASSLLKKELETMDFKAETANEYVKNHGKGSVISYAKLVGMGDELSKREVVALPMGTYLPEDLVDYSNALEPYFDDSFAEKQAEELLLRDPRLAGRDDIFDAFNDNPDFYEFFESTLDLPEGGLASANVALERVFGGAIKKGEKINASLLSDMLDEINFNFNNGAELMSSGKKEQNNIPRIIVSGDKEYTIRGDVPLGEGAFGSVYEAISKEGEVKAVKVLHSTKIYPDQATKNRQILYFLREYLILEKLKGSNSVLDVEGIGKFNDDGEERYFIVMEKGDKGFDDYIEEKYGGKGAIPYDDIINIAKNILLGVKEIQAKGIVLSDLKPENILIKDDTIKLNDFGYSFNFDKDQKDFKVPLIPTRAWTYGTEEYLPNKAYKGIYDYRSDRYALGMVLLNILLPIGEFNEFTLSSDHTFEFRKNPEAGAAIIGDYRDKHIDKLKNKYVGRPLYDIAFRMLSEKTLIDDQNNGRSWVDQDLAFIEEQENMIHMLKENYPIEKEKVLEEVGLLEGSAYKEQAFGNSISSSDFNNRAAYLTEMLEKKYHSVMSDEERKELEDRLSEIRNTEKRSLRVDLRDILNEDQIDYFEEMFDVVQKAFFEMSAEAALQNEYHGFWHVMNDVRLTLEGIKRMEMPENLEEAEMFGNNAFKTLIAALFHDIGYSKDGVATSGHVAESIKITRELLGESDVLGFDADEIDQISSIIALTDINQNSKGIVKTYKDKSDKIKGNDFKKMCDILLVADLTGAAAMPEYLSMLFPLYREYYADGKKSDSFGSFLQLAAGTQFFQDKFAPGALLRNTLLTIDESKLTVGGPSDFVTNSEIVKTHMRDGLIQKDDLNRFKTNMELIARVGQIYNLLKTENSEGVDEREIDSLKDMKDQFLGVSSVLIARENDFENMIYVLKALNEVVKGNSLGYGEIASLKEISKDPAFKCDALIALYGDIQNKLRSGVISGAEKISAQNQAWGMLNEILSLKSRSNYGFENIIDNNVIEDIFTYEAFPGSNIENKVVRGIYNAVSSLKNGKGLSPSDLSVLKAQKSNSKTFNDVVLVVRALSLDEFSEEEQQKINAIGENTILGDLAWISSALERGSVADGVEGVKLDTPRLGDLVNRFGLQKYVGEVFGDETFFTPQIEEQVQQKDKVTAASKSPGTDEIKSEELGDIEKIVSSIPEGRKGIYTVTSKDMEAAKSWAGKIGKIDSRVNEDNMKNVEVVSIDFSDPENGLDSYKDWTDALSYKKSETGNLVIVLNSNIRPDGTYQRRDKDFYDNTQAMGELIVHEYLESILEISHAEIKNLEMKTNGENALTELNKVLIKHMTIEQLDDIKPDHLTTLEETGEEFKSDPRDKFYNAVQVEIDARSYRDVLDNIHQGKHSNVIFVEVSEDQEIFDGTYYTRINNKTKRKIYRDYGSNIKVIYCTKEAMQEELKKVTDRSDYEKEGFRMVVFANAKDKNDESYKEIEKKFKDVDKNKLTGILPGSFIPDKENQMFSLVGLSVIGLGLMEYDRIPEDKRDSAYGVKLGNRIRKSLLNLLNDPDDSLLKKDINQFMNELLNGDIFIDIRKIDYSEIQDYAEAEAAVLESL